MVNAPVRWALLVGVMTIACSRGESLTDDVRPVTTALVTEDSPSSSETGGSSTGGSTTEEPGTTTATPMTEATGGSCPEGTLFCPCGDECEPGTACVDDLCQFPRCGDGVVQAPEECDDGDDDLSDECALDCKKAVCGDGFLHVGVELCDAGAANSDTGTCKLGCTKRVCGDGLVGPGENCDDGNDINTDACSNNCAPPGCGDGVVVEPEQCDDANTVNTDECLNSCVLAVCGDGIVVAGLEQCDDGNTVNTDACLDGCVAATCGDSIVQLGVEQCDDGNAIETDGCDNACQRVAALIGSFDVHAGKPWADDPPTYSCKEACAQIYGGEAEAYACSVEPTSITGTAYLSGWGDAKYCATPTDDDYKVNTVYNCGGPGCSYSAYVADHCEGGASINYCWRP